MSERYGIWKRSHEAEGNLAYSLEVFGNTIAKREGFKSVDGIEAVNLYLVLKHHWLPREVRAMTSEDKRFVLSEELHGWTLPRDAVSPAD
ncbi:hypothetical protein [Variovorax sp.]|uniref:hypothetical protein n=1 Tax=Variovorax sp. TaxID=1871043 RepID=UPI004038134F